MDAITNTYEEPVTHEELHEVYGYLVKGAISKAIIWFEQEGFHCDAETAQEMINLKDKTDIRNLGLGVV